LVIPQRILFVRLCRVLAGLGVLAALAAIAAALLLYLTLPPSSGTFTLPGLSEPPRVSRRLFGLSYAAIGMFSCIA
jgi:hypothetical protein